MIYTLEMDSQAPHSTPMMADFTLAGKRPVDKAEL
jgi:hypothetical protein